MYKNNYSFLSKILHHFFLGTNFIPDLLFDLEKTIFYKESYKEHINQKHIFVVGLARSGTTILTKTLHDLNIFASEEIIFKTLFIL